MISLNDKLFMIVKNAGEYCISKQPINPIFLKCIRDRLINERDRAILYMDLKLSDAILCSLKLSNRLRFDDGLEEEIEELKRMFFEIKDKIE